MNRLYHIAIMLFAVSAATAASAQCSAVFSANSPRCFKDSVTFTYTGSSYSPSFNWNFNDPFSGASNTDTSRNPRHYFSQPGTFNVRLIVGDTGSCSDTFFYSVKVLQLPKALLSALNPCLQAGTRLVSNATKDAADSIISYAWQFGDGGTSTQQNPFHNYAATGNKTVKLSVTTRYGCKDSVTTAVTIFDKLTLLKDLDSVCSGNLVNFSVQTGTSSPTQWAWDFGDATSSNASSPAHQYNGSGRMYPKVTVTYSNGSKCLEGPDSILILSSPDASFVTTTDTVQCFKGNMACVKLKRSGQQIKLRSVVYDDGYADNTTPLTDSIICHQYIDVSGSTYSVSVSIVDLNGCAATYTDTNTFRIHPQLIAKFNNLAVNGCFGTPVSITNTSNFSPPYITRYKWDFGDGSADSVHWNNPNHTYLLDGQFYITLMIEDKHGCWDTIKGNNKISNTSYLIDARIDTVYSRCFSNNRFSFTQTPISGGIIQWHFGDGANSPSWSTVYGYRNPGMYLPSVFISKNGCNTSLLLDTAIVHGPRAIISNISNRYQCQIKDTVIFNNNSALYNNGPVTVYWDAGDAFAPACTTDTKNGLNVNMNCRYSVDSSVFRHMYKPGQEGCYFPKLVVKDTTLGCADSVNVPVPLMRPDASTGISFNNSQFCIGPEITKQIGVNINQTTPTCGREASWVMWDSTCAALSGNFNNYWIPNGFLHNYDYNTQPCDSNGYVTLGIIIQNGSDSAGKVCRDTAFYHHILKFGHIDPRFSSSYNPALHYCENSALTFTPRDSTQDSSSLISAVWNWGDGTTTITRTTAPQKHIFTKAGSYNVALMLTHKNGCPAVDSMRVSIGIQAMFTVSDREICLGEKSRVTELVRYWGDPVDYWSIPGRPESLSWDFGDGNGFSATGPSPTILYNKIGNYTVRMAVADANGCLDTVAMANAIRVFNIISDFSAPLDTFICDQLVTFKANCTTYDSVNMFGQFDDRVASYHWTFKPGNSFSTFQNPSKFLKAGPHTVSLIATDTKGCSDTTTKTFMVIGPTAVYSFVGDSMGCQPLTLRFKNTSQNANSYAWSFHDSLNNVFNTNADTNVSFTYPDYGKYYPVLVAQGRYIVNGFPITCQAAFPDTIRPGFREVTVFELPKPSFTHLTDCATNTTAFTNTSVIHTGSITRYDWDFGDSSTSTQTNPSHQYADTGHYQVVLRAYSTQGCTDTAVRQIIISPTPATWFTFKEVCLGKQMQFFDSTTAYNDVIYKWQWNFGDGTGSTAKNPLKTYARDTVYTVSLTVTNIAGCISTISRTLKVHSLPQAAFTYSNQCLGMPVTLTSQSTSKETPASILWRLGDGTTDTAATLNKKYLASGSYSPRLIISTPFGCRDSIQHLLKVYPLPIAAFSVNDTTQCFRNHRFIFTDHSIDTGTLGYNWDFSTGNSTQQNPSYAYSQYGTYPIRLITTTVYGCKDTASATVTVFPDPVVAFTINNPVQCINVNKFIFTDQSAIASGSYSRTWHTGDNLSYTDSILQHRYTDSGDFNVTLYVLSNKGCGDTTTKTIHINPKPGADFSINDSTQCLSGNLFSFTNLSTTPYGSTTARWNFGDGNTASSFNAAHSYTAADTFTVTLITDNNTLCSDTLKKHVIVYPMPRSRFAVDDSLQCQRGNLFTFTNNSSIAYGTLSYNWKFGDGNTASSVNTAHSYNLFGHYTVNLKATSGFGCSDSTSKPLEVYAMPVTGFSVNKTGQCLTGNLFVYDDTSSIGSGTYNRLWDFGDTTYSNADPANKSYNRHGTFNVKLLLTSNNGCKDSLIKTVQVYPKPYPGFKINDSLQCERGNLFVFTNTSTIASGVLSYNWNFSDGNTTPATNPTHTYSTFGNYTVKLKATSAFGCVDSISKPVEVYAMPLPVFSINDNGQCINGNAFVFDDQSTIGSGTYNRLWDLGDTTFSSSDPVHKTYSRPGIFKLKLVLTSNNGCKDSLVKTIQVFPKPSPGFIINKPIQCEAANLFTFTNTTTLSSGTYTNTWHFGDGKNAFAQNTSHSYDTFGLYTVTLRILSDSGCVDSVQKMVQVNAMPIPVIYLNKSGQCLNDQWFQFTDTSTIGQGNYTRLWTLGENDTSHIKRPAKTFATHGTYTIWLKLSSDKGCSDSAQRQVTIYPKPMPSFTVNDSTQCINPNKFLFNSTSVIASGSIKWFWRFGNGSTDSLQNVSYSYPAHGPYTVRLRITSDKGCVDSISKPVEVYPKPVTGITVNDSGQCENTNMVIMKGHIAIPYTKITASYWNLGGSYVQGTTDTFHHYPAYGNYDVYFSAETEFGCKDTAHQAIVIYPKPRGGFTINDSAQCVNDNLFIFTNTTTLPYGTLTYLWNYGNGDTTTARSPQKIFTAYDSLLVTMIPQSDFGCEDTVSLPIIIFPKPNVLFAVNDSTQCINGNYFVFTNQSSIAYGSLTYLWQLGNGASTKATDTSYSYPLHGKYPVTLHALSSEGCRDSVMHRMITYPKPTPSFSINDTGQCLNNQRFAFTNLSAIDYGSNTYLWRFGDNLTDTAANPVHTYAAYGNYTVELVTASDYTCRDSTRLPIRVFAKPFPAFTINDADQCINTQQFTFTSQSSVPVGNIVTQNWFFTDGTTASGSAVAHHFYLPGFYNATLVNTTDSGCTDSLKKPVRVYPKPVAAFSVNDSAQCLRGNAYVFTQTAFDSSGIKTYWWGIAGDKQVSTPVVNHSFTTIGNKTITLRVTSNNGCGDTTKRDVYVKPMPDPAFATLRSYYCQSDSSLPLLPVTAGGTFSGKNTSGMDYDPKILWRDTVKYVVTVNGCTDSSIQYTNVYPPPKVSLGSDTLLCQYEIIQADVSFWNSTYKWSTGSDEPGYRFDKPGTYWITVTNICGVASDTITITYKDHNCHFYIPNAFSPNDDGHNDVFKPVLTDVEGMELEIYNRWGEKVFQGDVNTPGWDGTYRGSPVEQDVYMWVVNYRFPVGNKRIILHEAGTVTLLR